MWLLKNINYVNILLYLKLELKLSKLLKFVNIFNVILWHLFEFLLFPFILINFLKLFSKFDFFIFITIFLKITCTSLNHIKSHKKNRQEDSFVFFPETFYKTRWLQEFSRWSHVFLSSAQDVR